MNIKEKLLKETTAFLRKTTTEAAEWPPNCPAWITHQHKRPLTLKNGDVCQSENRQDTCEV